MSKYLTSIESAGKEQNTAGEISVTVEEPQNGYYPDCFITCDEAAVVNVTWYRKALTEKGVEEWEEMPETAKTLQHTAFASLCCSRRCL